MHSKWYEHKVVLDPAMHFDLTKQDTGYVEHASFIAILLLPQALSGWQDFLK